MLREVIDKTDERHAEEVRVKANGDPLPMPYSIARRQMGRRLV